MKISTKSFLIVAFGLISLAGMGQQNVKISGTKFTYPLLERWIAEYSKSNANLSFNLIQKFQASDKLDIRIVAHVLDKSELKPSDEVITISRFALLPIISEKNVLAQKTLKKGIKPEDLKKIFFEDPEDELEASKSNAQYQVYTRNARVCSSITFAKYFNDEPENIFGKSISGDDNYLLEAIKRDSIGITYNNLGYIYDLETRVPQKGVTILPIDFNKNGKLEKEEQVYQNLDLLLSFLEKNIKKQYLPSENVFFVIDKSQSSEEIKKFIRWVQNEGQVFAHAYGFLSLTPQNDKSAFIGNSHK